MLKCKYQENNLIEVYKCLPNDEYARLKSGDLSAWKDIFKDEICKISYTFDKSTLT